VESDIELTFMNEIADEVSSLAIAVLHDRDIGRARSRIDLPRPKWMAIVKGFGTGGIFNWS
jgi:hypothetical protein